MDDSLDWPALAAEVCRRHDAHTLLLYGSRARGDWTEASDVDLIALRAAGAAVRDVAPWRGLALDVHVHDEASVDALVQERAAHLVDARVLVEQQGLGTRVLQQVNSRLAQPPAPDSPGEWAAHWAWGQKMRGRIRATDPTLAALQRATLLVESPAAWAQVRGRWFFGARAMLTRWQREDPAMLAAYRAAAAPPAPPETFDRLLDRVFDHGASHRPPP